MFPRPARHFKASVAYFFFNCAPREFEAPQTFISFIGPAEMQCFGALFRQIFYSFKYGEVVGAKFLRSLIRGAKFIDRVAPQLKEHGGRDGVFLKFDENNKPKTSANEMPLNVYKKRSRLRWHSVAAAGPDMELVELSQRVRARLNAYSQSTTLRFAYCSLNGARKIRDERLRADSQIEKVAVIRLGSWHI